MHCNYVYVHRLKPQSKICVKQQTYQKRNYEEKIFFEGTKGNTVAQGRVHNFQASKHLLNEHLVKGLSIAIDSLHDPTRSRQVQMGPWAGICFGWCSFTRFFHFF